ncbi:MAG: DUF4097 domain-containing protein, partial [Clostridiales Family XIII bacterium]|nr:DUF4097 domain-containing protein [Clostridiales Family XIII bacterium]
MKKSILIPLIILIVGIGLALAGFGAGGLNSIWFDRGGAHLEERGELVRVDETYPKFANIEIDADYLHSIVIKEGAVFGLKGANYERYGGIDANLDGDTLVISATRKNKGGWLMDFGIGDFRNNDSFLEITCPKGAKLGTVSANLGAGDTLVSGLNCGDLTIDNAFGSVDASRVTCENLAITADAGKVGLD